METKLRNSGLLEELVATVRASAKYRAVSVDFIRSLGTVELAKRENLKEAAKATKNKLHQVGGAYLDRGVSYETWLKELQKAAQAGGMEEMRPICARIMAQHSSTRERLGDLDQFYAQAFAGLPPVRSVIDLACGFNPLAVPWMPLAAGATYYAMDIYEDLMAFLSEFVALCGYRAVTAACSVLQPCVALPPVDVALILKAIPCLEQVDKTAGLRLLEQTQAGHMLVSFPIHSLGGRSKGMAANYESRFRTLVEGHDWTVQRFEFRNELAFLVAK